MMLLSQCFIYKDFSFVIKLCCSSFSTTWYIINIFCGLKFMLSCSSLCVEWRKLWRTVYYLTWGSKCLKFMEKPMSSPLGIRLSKVAQPLSGLSANVGSTCRNKQPQLPSPGWLQREAPALFATAQPVLPHQREHLPFDPSFSVSVSVSFLFPCDPVSFQGPIYTSLSMTRSSSINTSAEMYFYHPILVNI